MRYAIVSDIHANRQAWDAVFKDIQKQGVDDILCLGDVVGYGPRPVDVLEDVYAHCDNFVLGNHDAVVGNRMDSIPHIRQCLHYRKSPSSHCYKHTVLPSRMETRRTGHSHNCHDTMMMTIENKRVKQEKQ